MENNLKITIWEQEVGRLSWDQRRNRSVFEYNKEFVNGNLDIAPLTASVRKARNRLPFYRQPLQRKTIIRLPWWNMCTAKWRRKRVSP